MAESQKTTNLGIQRIMGDKPLLRQQFNTAIDEIDQKVTPIDHQNSKAHFEMWKPNTLYGKQAAIRTSTCPSWGFYMCSVAGTSGLAEPQGYGEGDIITDGTCTWVLTLIGGGGVKKHGDLTGRSAIDQHPITAITGLEDALDRKVDTVPGKDLSTNDYSNVDKEKVDHISITKNVDLDQLSKDSHAHVNKKQLDKIGETNNKLTYNNKAIIGGATTWKAANAYDVDEVVVSGNLLYRCITAHTSTTFVADSANWEQLTIGYIPDWQPNREYVQYQIVTRGNSILRCIVTHTSLAAFDNVERNNWEVIAGKGAIITEWQPNTEYGIDEAVIYNDIIYRANTNHLSSVSFSSDMVAGSEKWRAVNSGGGSGTLQQITKLGVTAKKIIEVIINYTDTFKLPPVEVLKFEPGEQDQIVTVCEFNNADASDFIYDNKYIEFDGVMKPKIVFDVNMSEPVALLEGFYSESEEIDFGNYKKVEAVG